jgi:hypothetical protein
MLTYVPAMQIKAPAKIVNTARVVPTQRCFRSSHFPLKMIGVVQLKKNPARPWVCQAAKRDADEVREDRYTNSEYNRDRDRSETKYRPHQPSQPGVSVLSVGTVERKQAWQQCGNIDSRCYIDEEGNFKVTFAKTKNDYTCTKKFTIPIPNVTFDHTGGSENNGPCSVHYDAKYENLEHPSRLLQIAVSDNQCPVIGKVHLHGILRTLHFRNENEEPEKTSLSSMAG